MYSSGGLAFALGGGFGYHLGAGPGSVALLISGEVK
jgi:hypothetical protein